MDEAFGGLALDDESQAGRNVSARQQRIDAARAASKSYQPKIDSDHWYESDRYAGKGKENEYRINALYFSKDYAACFRLCIESLDRVSHMTESDLAGRDEAQPQHSAKASAASERSAVCAALCDTALRCAIHLDLRDDQQVARLLAMQRDRFWRSQPGSVLTSLDYALLVKDDRRALQALIAYLGKTPGAIPAYLALFSKLVAAIVPDETAKSDEELASLLHLSKPEIVTLERILTVQNDRDARQSNSKAGLQVAQESEKQTLSAG
ncbi:uncharacterized protein L969DRAFT_45717 [Mixia osmundae IAM 14324]|uniref:Uncharacterized protein n=1 Tax=Mixia osmundae (strain CBS 9802 / IAM 14324 / JCM 22182 / KY 12970) TaxID=764103 RepID=G7DTS3_MIXOS|nr:uncharacterized protein L969DRAFT_45717 [Mixia osmundae IAM 14324]KEI41699.1 hypothetical protein L969DRAFT_45717 [Mixia osmundae IAM 14324]GAA93983.1 hypothetical protein E5Q_00630 [Mixia osmundae IAM 14324]